MIKVATLYSANINSLIGPSGNIRRLYSNQKVFRNSGIELLGPYCNNSLFDDVKEYQKSAKHRVNQIGKRVLSRSFLGSIFWLYRTNIIPGERVVRQFIESGANADVVVFRDYYSCHSYLNKVKSSRPATILFMHNDGNPMYMLLKSKPKLNRQPFLKLAKRFIDNLFDEVDCIAFISQNAKSSFLACCPQYEDKSFFVHQGVDKPQISNDEINFKRCKKDIVLVCVGTVSDRKNQISIIKALDDYSLGDIKLILVGDGEGLEDCQAYVSDHGLNDRVFFAGGQDYVGDYLELADAFILASLNEGLPNAAVEAMSYGLAMILSDVGCCSELIASNGWLTGTTPDEIKAVLYDVVENRDLLPQYGKRSKDLYEKYYTLSSMCEDHAQAYKFAYRKHLAEKES